MNSPRTASNTVTPLRPGEGMGVRTATGMKIIIERNRPSKIVTIIKAKYLKDYVMRITFSDGNDRAVDFKPFLTNSGHPEVKKFLKESNFKKFKIIQGNINWEDYQMIFPIQDLYQGKI